MTTAFLTALAAAQIATSGHALSVRVEQPAATQSIPRGAQRVPMATVTLEAGCAGDVTVRGIRVTHTGLGSASDIERVYATEGNRRVSRAAALPRNPAKATLRLGSLVVPACKTRVLSVMADYSRDADPQSEHALGIASFADIDASTEDIGGSLSSPSAPVRVAPTSDGSVSVEYLPQLTSVLFGPRRTLLRMRLSAEGEDVLIHSITLTNDGKARDGDLASLFLGTRDATLSNTVSSLDGDKATFTFDPPLLVEKGENRLLLLTGDVRASRKKTIDFQVDEEADIDARPRTGRSDTFQ